MPHESVWLPDPSNITGPFYEEGLFREENGWIYTAEDQYLERGVWENQGLDICLVTKKSKKTSTLAVSSLSP